jgi:hypothetical protein
MANEYGLRILRKVDNTKLDGPTIDLLLDEEPGPVLGFDVQMKSDGKYHVVMTNPIGYVDNDAPRSVFFTDTIMQATLGFAIMDANGRILGEVEELLKAEEIIQSAKVELKFEVDWAGNDEFVNDPAASAQAAIDDKDAEIAALRAQLEAMQGSGTSEGEVQIEPAAETVTA